MDERARPPGDPAPAATPDLVLETTMPGRTPDTQAVAPELRLLATSLKARIFGGESAPVRFGRYTLLERIGEGGMGVVFAAYDDALDRKVAVKIQRAGHRDGHTQARLLREAKALAQLSHPNVVQVFDVGEIDGQVFLAMEFVRGRTLAAWLAVGPRSSEAVLDVLLQAGRGLAAAHAAGVVHRDFKPENLLVGDDGRARVADFGLARADLDDAGVTLTAPTSTALTTTGLLIGTPAYMSPEQFRGARTVDARSDQFSFCAVAWECLYGERPFPGHDVASIREAVLAGRVRAPGGPTHASGRVQRALLRGLKVDPQGRHPSMEALLAELAPAGRGRLLRAAVVSAAAAAGIAAALALVGREDPAARCSASADARVDAVWNDDTRAAVHAGLSGVGASFAHDVAARVEAAVERHTREIRDMYADSCEASARGEQSSALLDLRAACLHGQIRELDALLRVFARADAGVAARAIGAVEGLPSPARCGPELVGAGAPPEQPDEVDAVRAELARAAAELRAGDYTSGLVIAGPAADRAAELAYPPLVAEALLLRGELETRASRFDLAAKTFAAAMLAARRARAPELAGRIAFARAEIELASRNYDDATPWLDAAAADLGPQNPDPALRIALRGRLSQTDWVRAPNGPPFDELERTVDEAAQTLGPDHTMTIRLLRDTGKAFWARSDYERGERMLTRALDASLRAFGPEHPETALAVLDVGKLAWVRADYVRALGIQLQALTLLQAAHGERHTDVGLALSDIGATLGMAGDHDGAEPYFLASLAVFEATVGNGSALVALALDNLSQVALHRGDLDEALRLTRRAVVIRLAIFDPGHPEVARSHLALGERLFRLGDLEASIDEYEQAVSVRKHLANHIILLARGQFGLARSLVAAGRERDRALALARTALENFERHGPGAADEIDATRALLRELGEPPEESSQPRN